MDLDYRVMPYPIARLFVEMLEEEDPRLLFRGLIKLFAGGIKYVSLIAIADYVRNCDSDAVNRALYQPMRRPSLGHWVQFLRSINTHYHETGRAFHVDPLAGILSGRTNKLVDYLVKLRNAYVHPDIFPTLEASGAIFDEASFCLEALFKKFSFLSEYPLIRQNQETGASDTLMGPGIAADLKGKSRFQILDADGQRLDITPFLLISVDLDFKGLLVYDTLLKSSAKYILGNKYDFVTIDEREENPVRQLKKIFDRFSSNGDEEAEREIQATRRKLNQSIEGDRSGIIEMAHSCAYQYSRRIYDDYFDSGRFLPATYVKRNGMKKAFQALLDTPEKRMLVIVGDSGTGKSTEICHWYIHTFRQDITLFISGRTTKAEDAVNVISRELFGRSEWVDRVEQLIGEIDRRPGGGRFVILFDGINETDNPRVAFERLIDFSVRNDCRCLKIVCTCRSHSWDLIRNSGILVNPSIFVQSKDGGCAHILQPFDSGELQQALPKYEAAFNARFSNGQDGLRVRARKDRKILKNPLILKFLFTAFAGRQINIELSVEKIMTAFTMERIRPQDMPFLTCYLMEYLYDQGCDVLHFDELIASLDHKKSEAADLGNYERLLEHLCSDQVHSTEYLWFCPVEDCRNNYCPVMVFENDARPICTTHNRFLERYNRDNRSSYQYLLSESVLAESKSGDSVSFRIVYDRYFEYLMSEYLILKIYRREMAFMSIFRKAKASSIFIEPLKTVAMEFWSSDRFQMISIMAMDDSFEAYQILRETLDRAALEELPDLLKDIEQLSDALGTQRTFRRACIHALLSNPSLAAAHAGQIIDGLTEFIPRCDDVDYNDVGEYIVALRGNGVDLISMLVESLCGRLVRKVTIGSAFKLLAEGRDRQRLKSEIKLLTTAVLFGLGKYYHDRDIKRSVAGSGLALIKQILSHPVLSLFSGWAAGYLSRQVVKIYRNHGPLACNYFEMGFQIEVDREAIRRFGRMFFVERQNVFDLDFEHFYNAIHSENGLLTWYAISVLPLHYRASRDRANAADYLKQMVLEGTDSDRYVAVDVLVTLAIESAGPDAGLAEALNAVETVKGRNRWAMFYRPSDYGVLKTSKSSEAHISILNRLIAEKYNPYSLPWILCGGGVTRRFYANASYVKYELYRMTQERQERAEVLIRMLDACDTDNLLCFGEDEQSEKRFCISMLIQAVAHIAKRGHIPEAFSTMDAIIEMYLIRRSDGDYPFDDVYRFAIGDALMRMKEHLRNEVIAYIEKFDGNDALSFLDQVRLKAVERERQMNKSHYGHIIYQETFKNSRAIREAFGEFTIKAADAADAAEFIHIYTTSFMKWFAKLEV